MYSKQRPAPALSPFPCFRLPGVSNVLIRYTYYFPDLPVLSKVSCGILSDCIVDPIMKEFESVVADLSGANIQAFRLVDGIYKPYQTSRAPLSVRQTSTCASCCSTTSNSTVSAYPASTRQTDGPAEGAGKPTRAEVIIVRRLFRVPAFVFAVISQTAHAALALPALFIFL